MSYVAMLVAVLIGGGISLYNDVLGSLRDTLVDVQVPIEAAQDVVTAIEAQLPPGVLKNNSATSTGEGSQTTMGQTTETMLVAGGCFWCVEADLEKLPGVVSVVSGYAGGSTTNPTYEDYARHGHREVVQVTYDPTRVSFEEILVYAMKHMDPTDDDGSFGDRGEYYSPAFYYKSGDEKTLIENLIRDMNENGPYPKPLAVEVEAVPPFYPAEDFHQDYYKGAVSKLKYQYYRAASGRDRYIQSVWGSDTGPTLPWRTLQTPASNAILETSSTTTSTQIINTPMWQNYVKPSKEDLRARMDALAFRVTQENGTERAGTSPLDANYERGIYVDILSGEPLFSSKDKFDSGTGWPSFVRPITPEAVTEHTDRSFFTTRREIRSAIADNHLGHVFPDGPRDRGGMRYCMNGVALRFIPKADMAASGYSAYLSTL